MVRATKSHLLVALVRSFTTPIAPFFVFLFLTFFEPAFAVIKQPITPTIEQAIAPTIEQAITAIIVGSLVPFSRLFRFYSCFLTSGWATRC